MIPLGVLQQQVGGSGAVVSIEVIEHTQTTWTSTHTLTKGQDPTQCVPFFTRRSNNWTGGANMDQWMYDVDVFDDSGTPKVTFKRDTTESSVIVCYIVEFNSDIDVQKIYVTGDNTAAWTAACTAVDLTKAFIIATGECNSSTDNDLADYLIETKFNSTTQIGFSRGNGSSQIHGHVYVVEDTTGDYFDVQTASDSQTDAGSYDQTITSVDMDSTMIVGSMKSAYTSTYAHGGEMVLSLNSATAVRMTLRTTLASYRAYHAFVVEWKDGTSVQRIAYDQTSTTASSVPYETNHAIDTVDPDNSIAFGTLLNPSGTNTKNSNGLGNSGAGVNEEGHVLRIAADGTTLDAERFSTNYAARCEGEFQVVEFA